VISGGVRYALIVGGAIVSILLFLLAGASDNSGFFGRYYSWLLGLTAAMAFLLLIVVVVALGRLYSRYKAGKFGSRLMARLVLLFAGIGILPGLVIFIVSVQFVSHSIDSWFDVKIESAIESGLNLGRAALDESLSELGATAQTAAATLAGQSDMTAQPVLARLLADTSGLQSVMLVDANGAVLSAATEDRGANLAADAPNERMLRSAGMPGGYAQAEGGVGPADAGDEAADGASNALDAVTGLRLRVVMAVPEPPGVQQRYLQLLQAVPVGLASNAEVLRSASTEYRLRLEARTGLRKMYIVTLTLTLLLAIFGAIGSAFLIAGNLAQPLLVLAEGTQAVAEGDLSPRPIVETNDELGTLTRSFNAMTGQLFEARSAVERNRAALQSAKAHLESVLANMSAGVIVLDAEGVVVNSNDAAYRILQVEPGAMAGPLNRIAGLEHFSNTVTRSFSAQSAHVAAERRKRAHWQQQIEIPRDAQRKTGAADEHEHDIVLLARGISLAPAGGRRQRLHRRVRRYLGRDHGPALGGLGRGGAPSGARNQEPAHADPAGGRAHADEAGRAPAASAGRPAPARHDHDRQSGRRDEAHGRRLPRLCAHAAGDARPARPEWPDRRDPQPVPGRRQQRHHSCEPRAGPAARDGRRDPVAPGDPQPGPERAGCVGRARAGRTGATRGHHHRGDPVHGRRRPGRHRGAAGDRRQRARFRAPHPGARVRAVRDDQGARHGSWPPDGQENHR
jgi:HAMP domain-containing protein